MNLRKDNKGAALKAWKKLGPALIQKPLQHIANRTNTRTAEGQVVFSPQYLEAAMHARFGDGDAVQRIARSLP